MQFIFYLILIYLVFRLLSWLALKFFLSKARKFTGGQPAQEEEDSKSANKRKKFFKKDDGEYVDFEEMNKK